MHQYFLRQALLLAKQRRGFCAPNPSVGAILVNSHREIIAQANHDAHGAAHAELAALQQAGDRARDATLYVTLQPCSHWGLTPPCVDRIIQAGVARVYYGYADPNQTSVSQSAEKLATANIANEWIQVPEITDFYQSYHHWVMHQRPWATAKLALSLDGKIAGERGQPIKITGAQANAWTHRCRWHTDALLTTAKTVEHDDPRFTARMGEQVVSKPVFILDPRLEIQWPRRILTENQDITLLHDGQAPLATQRRLQDKAIQLVEVTSPTPGYLDLHEVLNVVGQRGLHDVWIEAGGTLLTHLLEANLLQRAVFYVAAKTLGDASQAAFTQAMNLTEHARSVKWQALGKDSLCTIEWDVAHV